MLVNTPVANWYSHFIGGNPFFRDGRLQMIGCGMVTEDQSFARLPREIEIT